MSSAQIPAGTLHAITVLGHDRPGIIAETTDKLAGLGLNIEDTSMTLLRGHFAMTLICAGPAGDAEVEAALAPLTADGSLTVTVREVPHEEDAVRAAASVGADRARRGPARHRLPDRGGDRPGRGQHHRPDHPAGRRPLPARRRGLAARGRRRRAVAAAIKQAAADLGVGATLRPAEADEL